MNKIKKIKLKLEKKIQATTTSLLLLTSILCNIAYSNNYNANTTNLTTPASHINNNNNNNNNISKEIYLNKIIAIVNTQVITQQELDAETSRTQKMLQQQGISVPGHIILEKQVLKQMITEKLKLQLAKKNGLTASDQEAEQAFKQIAIQNNLTPEKLRPVISAQYGSFEEYNKNLKKQVTINKLQQQIIASHNINISEKSIRKFIEKQNKAKKDYTQYKLEHILIPIPNNPSPKDIQETRKKAENILEKIKQGTSFKEAAVTYSASEDALKGGVMPWKTLDELPEAFQQASSMEINQVSNLMQSPGGFNIIKLVGKRKQPIPTMMISNYKIQKIVIKTSPILSSHDAKARLIRLRKTLTHSNTPFAEIAKANSDDHESSQNNGILKWKTITQIRSENPKMAEILADLKINNISKPFEYNNNWYLIKLLGKEKIDNTKELERQHAQQMLFQKRAMAYINTWTSELQGSSYIKILSPELR